MAHLFLAVATARFGMTFTQTHRCELMAMLLRTAPLSAIVGSAHITTWRVFRLPLRRHREIPLSGYRPSRPAGSDALQVDDSAAQRNGHGLGPVICPRFLHDVLRVHLDRAFGDKETIGDVAFSHVLIEPAERSTVHPPPDGCGYHASGRKEGPFHVMCSTVHSLYNALFSGFGRSTTWREQHSTPMPSWQRPHRRHTRKVTNCNRTGMS